MKNMHLTPQLAANLKSCETSIRCLDTITHDDLSPLREEMRERLVLTAEELRTYMTKHSEPEISELRAFVVTYVELELFVGMSINSVLYHVHHLMHCKSDDDYCRKVAARISENAPKLREALQVLDNDKPSILKLLELLSK